MGLHQENNTKEKHYRWCGHHVPAHVMDKESEPRERKKKRKTKKAQTCVGVLASNVLNTPHVTFALERPYHKPKPSSRIGILNLIWTVQMKHDIPPEIILYDLDPVSHRHIPYTCCTPTVQREQLYTRFGLHSRRKNLSVSLYNITTLFVRPPKHQQNQKLARCP